MRVLAIDPGREKCGLVAADGSTIVDREVARVEDLAAILKGWVRRYPFDHAVLGDRTGRDEVRRVLAAELPGVPVAVVREANTTLLARRRYFADHPSRGWRRLLPLSMQVPPEPYDDYAAAIILERFLEGLR